MPGGYPPPSPSRDPRSGQSSSFDDTRSRTEESQFSIIPEPSTLEKTFKNLLFFMVFAL